MAPIDFMMPDHVSLPSSQSLHDPASPVQSLSAVHGLPSIWHPVPLQPRWKYGNSELSSQWSITSVSVTSSFSGGETMICSAHGSPARQRSYVHVSVR